MNIVIKFDVNLSNEMMVKTNERIVPKKFIFLESNMG